MPRSFLQEMITSSNKVFKDCVSDLAVNIRNLGNLPWVTDENDNTIMQNAGS